MEEMENPYLKEQHCKFDESVIYKLVDIATETGFPDKYLIPNYDAYVDDMTEGGTYAPDKDLEPIPETSDNFVNADFMLPCGGTIWRGWVIERKFDADGDPVWIANDNTILDSAIMFEVN